jgi:NAD(P)-dependent dehydrogenase (short-subunit alcohol dehydrogenase family)
MQSRTHSRTALITGGTTEVGRATVRLVHSQGYPVLITDGHPITHSVGFVPVHTLAIHGGMSAA